MQTKKLWRIVAWAELLGLLLTLPVLAAPEEPHRAGVVIDFGSGRVDTYCVTFTESSLTGYELLQRTGMALDVATSANGIAICRIGGASGAGCSPSNCFCQFPKYWSYWRESGGAWGYSNVGAGSAQVTDGMVNGWLWGNATQPPTMISLDAICASVEPAPTDTPTATAIATPTTTPTPSPTATVRPPQSQAAQATVTPEPSAKFWTDAETLEAGTCMLVHWETVDVIEAWLDGDSVDVQGTMTLCPCEPEAYELEVTYSDGSTETLVVKVEVEGACAEGGLMMDFTLTPTSQPSVALTLTAPPTRTPEGDRGTPPGGSPPPEKTPEGERGDLPPGTSPAPLEGTPGTFLSILPTPTPPPLLPTAMPPEEGEPAGDIPQSTTETTWTPEAKATLPESTAAALLATPTRHLMDEPDTETGVSAYFPEPVEGAPAASEETAADRVLQNWSGYLTFGLMLVALGGAHLFIQRRNG